MIYKIQYKFFNFIDRLEYNLKQYIYSKKPKYKYHFIYWNSDRPTVYKYSYITSKGYKEAEEVAFNNMQWDACDKLLYQNKEKV